MFRSEMLIGGEWVEGAGEILPVQNPATEETIGTIRNATSEETDRAIHAARKAFPVWAGLSPFKRAVLLHRAGDLIAERHDAIARLMTAEQGKPLNEAKGEVAKLAQTLHFYAEEGVRVHGEIIPNESNSYQSLVVREPIGVVAAISPWNYPAELIGWKIGGALAAGCTIVVKPPELTPFSPLAIARALVDAGIPAGVVNLVTGKGSTVGQHMVESPLVDKVAFTGSGPVGLKIQQSATTVKKLSLELGGNCPLIVTASADLDAAVKGAARRSFRNMGQICIAINRIYVHESVYEAFLTKLAAAANALTIDNGLDNPAADLGAMASAEPLEKTKAHLADALARGARLLAGGSRPEGPKFAKGFFFRPTVVADCTHEMQVMTEETFGPLVGVAPYRTLAEAVEKANDTPYGLASYAYTKHMDEMRYISTKLDYGNVAINNVDAGIINAPYGGRKQSGVGYEHGREGMLEYFNFKHVRVCFDEPEDA
jgi:succinate-semialdehyde dehydrogenase/glutarate-semialdehyde dehydrogenase